MTPAARRYIATETLVSVVINLALSAAFAWLFFNGREMIAVSGPKGYGVDFLPQTFMITLMSVTVPTLLTRKRRATGAVAGQTGREGWPARLIWRAPLAAILASLVLGGGAWLLASWLLPQAIDFKALMSVKLAYGALLAALVTPLAVAAALRDDQSHIDNL